MIAQREENVNMRKVENWKLKIENGKLRSEGVQRDGWVGCEKANSYTKISLCNKLRSNSSQTPISRGSQGSSLRKTRQQSFRANRRQYSATLIDSRLNHRSREPQKSLASSFFWEPLRSPRRLLANSTVASRHALPRENAPVNRAFGQ